MYCRTWKRKFPRLTFDLERYGGENGNQAFSEVLGKRGLAERGKSDKIVPLVISCLLPSKLPPPPGFSPTLDHSVLRIRLWGSEKRNLGRYHRCHLLGALPHHLHPGGPRRVRKPFLTEGGKVEHWWGCSGHPQRSGGVQGFAPRGLSNLEDVTGRNKDGDLLWRQLCGQV